MLNITLHERNANQNHNEDFPGGTVENTPANAGVWVQPWSRTVPCAAEQLSWCAPQHLRLEPEQTTAEAWSTSMQSSPLFSSPQPEKAQAATDLVQTKNK